MGCTDKELQQDLTRWLANTVDANAHSEFRAFEGDVGGQRFRLRVYLSPHFRRVLRKSRPAQTAHLVKALRNVKYGFDIKRSQSRGGRDGIFAVSRDFRPRNAMMVKLYNRYFDTPQGKAELRHYFDDPGATRGVRVVCHSLRLLGFMELRDEDGCSVQKLVLADMDATGKAG
ncbi:MAG: hypothetical protein V2A79_05285 [Planctomycetota bacterium]